MFKVDSQLSIKSIVVNCKLSDKISKCTKCGTVFFSEDILIKHVSDQGGNENQELHIEQVTVVKQKEDE